MLSCKRTRDTAVRVKFYIDKVNIYFIKSDRGANGFITHCISAANCFDTNEIRWENAVNGKLILRHFVYADRITNFIFTGRIISIKLNLISSRTCYRAPGNHPVFRCIPLYIGGRRKSRFCAVLSHSERNINKITCIAAYASRIVPKGMKINKQFQCIISCLNVIR